MKWILWSAMALVLLCSSRARAQQGIKLKLDSVTLHDGLLWLRFQVKNRSAFDFRVDWFSFTIRQRHRVRQTAIQEIRIQPVFAQQPALIPGDSTSCFSYGLVPRVLGKEKKMLVELKERNGDRRVGMVISSKRLLTTKRLKGMKRM